MQDVLKVIDTYGLPLVILIFLGWLFGRILTKLNTILFDDEKGILTNVAKKHIEFMERVAKASEINTETFREFEKTNIEISDATKSIKTSMIAMNKSHENIEKYLSDNKSIVYHKRTHRAIDKLCDAIVDILIEQSPQMVENIKPIMDQIKILLQNDIEDKI